MIHPTAIVDPRAKIDATVEIGPYAVIGADVSIGARTRVGAHAVIEGPCTIGKDNVIYQFAALGAACQDLKYAGEPTELVIGDRNTIREFATMHRGTVQDNSLTKIGNDGLFMAYSHIAHDCMIDDHVIVANSVQIAGHVQVGDHAILGGGTLIHQFVQVGAHSMTGAGTVLFKDLPAFVLSQGNPAHPHAMNFEGMRRRGFSEADRRLMKQAYRSCYRSKQTLEQAIIEMESWDANPALQMFIDSLKSSKRGIIR